MSKQLLAILTLALVLGAGVFAWFQMKPKADQVATPAPIVSEPTVIPSDTIDTSDWKTYRNEEYGFEFKYPEKEFYIKQDTDSAGVVYITILQSDRTGVDADTSGKIGVLLNDLPTEKYAYSKAQGFCSSVGFNSRTAELCSENKIELDLAKSSYESFANTGLCEKNFGLVFPVYLHNPKSQSERHHVLYVTCDENDIESMKMLSKIFRSIHLLK